jgi:hypothetical protein
MTDAQIASLKTELTTDPASLGYAPLIVLGSHNQISALINAVGDTDVQLPSMDRDSFLTAVLPGVIRLASLDVAIQSKWDRLLAVARAASVISIAAVTGIMAMAVSDGVMTSDEVAGIGKRKGSRAEVVFGAGVVVFTDDVSLALRA